MKTTTNTPHHKGQKKPIFFEISDQIYHVNIVVFAHCDLNYVHKVIKENRPELTELLPKEEDEKTADGLFFWRTNSDGGKLRVLFLRDDKLDTIAHEVFHAASHVLRDRGIELNSGSEEAFAHYFCWLFSRVCSGITPKKT